MASLDVLVQNCGDVAQSRLEKRWCWIDCCCSSTRFDRHGQSCCHWPCGPYRSPWRLERVAAGPGRTANLLLSLHFHGERPRIDAVGS